MIEIPCDAVRDALNDDFEFRHAARYWDASIRIGIGDRPLCVRIAQGQIEEIRPWAPEDALDVGIDAPADEWEKMLAPEPKPFYQSFLAAATHHGVALSGDPLDSYAYMAALNRLIEVMRAHTGIQ